MGVVQIFAMVGLVGTIHHTTHALRSAEQP
jgi:hypothetical protein